MRYLIVLNDPPYGTERCYNGLRLALALVKRDDVTLRVFLLGDAVLCAKAGQVTPQGYYNVERMLKGLAARAAPIGACGSCLDARGLQEAGLVAGAQRSSLEELTEWTLEADNVVVF